MRLLAMKSFLAVTIFTTDEVLTEFLTFFAADTGPRRPNRFNAAPRAGYTCHSAKP
jgi:hypothetical protein